MKKLFLGNEALAQGAIDAGLSGVYAYPGTPSTEITEYIQKSKTAKELGIHSQWSVNEKTAMEAALGMSYAGKKSMVVMKHVGLNVAADVFMNMSVSGINGGMVVVVADDPSMHSSQNEQDSRYYGKFAMVPILEPTNQQEAYDITRYAFSLSERFKLPVLLRLVTRLSHSRAVVETFDSIAQNKLGFPESPTQFQLIPMRARGLYQGLLDNQKNIQESATNSPFNKVIEGTDPKLGIIAAGIAYNYVMENYEGTTCPHTIFKVSEYPLPKKQIKHLLDTCEQVIVFEDGYPFIEEIIGGFFNEDQKVIGRLTGHVNRTGELTPDIVGKALGFDIQKTQDIPAIVSGRPPELCTGCGHIDLFESINSLIPSIGERRVFGDIGCSALGVLPPFNTIDTLIEMGASVTMAKGATDAGVKNAIAIIGDSTFTHSGMTGLLDAIYEKTPLTVIISDNSAIAMTGAQDSTALGKIKKICLGLGIEEEHLKVIVPLHKNHDSNVETIQTELDYEGVSVIISQRPCVQIPSDKKAQIRAFLKNCQN